MNKFLASLSLFALLAGCGGGSSPPTEMVATSNTTVAATPALAAAVSGLPFTFPNGVPDFGTTNATTVTITDSAASQPTPTFAVSTNTGTATGSLAFGSCDFKVTGLTGSVGNFQIGQVIVVKNCNANVATAGVVANGLGQQRSLALVLGTASSNNQTVTVSINPGGELTINGDAVGTVTLTPVTGAF